MGKFNGFLIVSDIDGTLTDENQMLSVQNLNAIEYFKSESGIFTIATGRLPEYFIEKGFDKLITCPAILLNGAGIYDFNQGKYTKLTTFDNDCKEILYFIKNIGGFHHIDFCYKNKSIDSFMISDNCEDFPSKIVIVFENEQSAIYMRDALRTKYKNRYEIFRTWNTGVEVLPKGATKGEALKILKTQLKNIKYTASIGDYENDISMIECADISFIPENAVQELKQQADYIVAHHSKNAVKEMIEILDKEFSKNTEV